MSRYERILADAEARAEAEPSRAKRILVVTKDEQLEQAIVATRREGDPVEAEPDLPAARGTVLDRFEGANRTERAYGEFLEREQAQGRVLRFWWQPGSFALSRMRSIAGVKGDFYRPDFMVQLPSGLLEIHETKGFMRDDARTKLKVFCAIYPFPVQLVKRRAGQFTSTLYQGSLP